METMTLDKKEKCTWCNKKAPAHNSILVPGETQNFRICLHCYNQEISKATGIEYDPIQLHPVILKDRDGKDHDFHFSLRLMGDEQVLTAFEMKEDRPAGYELSMMGNTEDGIFPLFSALYIKMLNALAKKHIFKNPNTEEWEIRREDTVRGRIACPEESGEDQSTPAMIIDGKSVSWNDFGRMLMTYEGSDFKLRLIDNSEGEN